MKIFDRKFRALGSDNHVRLAIDDAHVAEKILRAIDTEVRRIEKKFSRYDPESIVSKINSAAGIRPIQVDQETAGLIDYAYLCFGQSEGLFDITSGILRKAWDFSSRTLPTDESLRALCSKIGLHKVSWRNSQVLLPESGMEIDLGGIGKEYAVDRAVEVAMAEGATSGFINLGGDLRIIGPKSDGSPWNIGIRDPRVSGAAMLTITLVEGALATSGDYERFMEVDGKRYHHILNPKTGISTPGFRSVSTIADKCLVAGTISTIAMLFGEERGLGYLNRVGVPYAVVTSSGKVHSSGTFPVKSNSSPLSSTVDISKTNAKENQTRVPDAMPTSESTTDPESLDG